MEIKVNKEIREYTETIFFGLSMRQFIFSAIACAVAVIIYFSLRNYLVMEILSWICIIGALPFAILGFVKYNGMTAEKFIKAWVKSEILMPRHLLFKAENIYYEMLKAEYKEMKREGLKVENFRISKKRKRKSKNS